MNSYADNMAYVDSLNKEERYMQKAKAMFDDDGSGNTGIEIIRLNKKFDIFMKRFMRAEEDIKEVKQNFYRVMHCAFAKYEQGFKRKNEYLERRRIKRKEEIERGVASELKKRGMTGELDDPLVMSTVGGGRSGMDTTHNLGMNPEESSIGMHMGGGDETAMSIGKAGGMGIDDSELSNNIVGISATVPKNKNTKPAGIKKNKKDKKKNKKVKSKRKSISSDEAAADSSTARSLTNNNITNPISI